MVKFFLAPRFDESLYVPFLYNIFPPNNKELNLFLTYKDNHFIYKNFELVSKIDESDFILIPQGVRVYDSTNKEYIDTQLKLGKKYNKKVVIFLIGDLHHDVYIDDAIVFKAFNYRHLKRDNEVYVPVYVDDLLNERQFIPLNKDHEKPIIGFCGWSKFNSPRNYISYSLKNFLVNLQKIVYLNGLLEVFKKGVYFRRKSIRICKKSKLVETNFIERPSYSGSKKTIAVDPIRARQEFIDNILQSDFTLCPKGDANTSARLYEVLSLGRIPIIIDTDVILPLEDVLDYSKFSIRVHFSELNKLPQIVRERYDQSSQDDFLDMQIQARNIFEQYLRFDSFFNYIFARMPRLLQGESISSFLRE